MRQILRGGVFLRGGASLDSGSDADTMTLEYLLRTRGGGKRIEDLVFVLVPLMVVVWHFWGMLKVEERPTIEMR